MAPYDESIPDLLRGTIRDGLGLIRDEIVLVRTEMREEYVRLKGTLLTATAAAVTALLAVIMLLDTIAWAAAYAFEWPPWAGFALVTVPLAIIAVVLAMVCRTMMTRAARPFPKSVETMKENAEWLRTRTQS